MLVGGHGPKRVAAVHLLVGFLELHAVALADVAVEGAFQESAEQGQRERVAFHLFNQFLKLIHQFLAIVERDVATQTSLHV